VAVLAALVAQAVVLVVLVALVLVVLVVQVALEAKEVLEATVVLEEATVAPWRNQRCQYISWQSLRCTVHQSHQMDIRHKWKRRPIYSNNIGRPWVIPWRVRMGPH